MKGWFQIANCIFNAFMISHMAQMNGMHIQPIMGMKEDGLAILLEQRGIVGGWEFRGQKR